jgi:cyclase
MIRERVIPLLLLEDGGLVKTQKFRNPVYVGDPINVVKIFNEKEVDELILLDIRASRRGVEPDFALIESIVSEAFMPVCYGGGVRTVEHAQRVLALGVEKVAINTAAMETPSLVTELSQRFGAQCVVGVVDVERRFGRHVVYSHSGRTPPERDPVRWAQRLVALGAGELLIQSVDRDGTMSGFDLELLRSMRGAVAVPVVAAGGAGTLDTLLDALRTGSVSALGVGARFVFFGPHRAVLITYLSGAERRTLRTLMAKLRAAQDGGRDHQTIER